MQESKITEHHFRYKVFKNTKQIFDVVRKKFVTLTPEEWVRQNFLVWLIQELNYPAGLIAVEKELKVNELKKRYDIVVYNLNQKPAMLVECKSSDVQISQKVFDQASRYNLTLKVPYLVVTNGITNYCCYIDIVNENYSFLENIPDYNQLLEC